MKKVWYIVKLGIDRVTATALVEKGRINVEMMTGNPAFLAPNPTPNPTLADFTTALDKLADANEAFAFNKGKVEKAERDTAWEELKEMFRYMGGYVQLASKGDKDIILSAGFLTTKAPAATVPTVPTDVRAEATKAQKQILVRWKASKGHRFYKVYRTEGDPTLETGWELIAETGKVRFMSDGLTRFKTYSFRIVAVGTSTNSIHSDAATATAA